MGLGGRGRRRRRGNHTQPKAWIRSTTLRAFGGCPKNETRRGDGEGERESEGEVTGFGGLWD